MLRSMMLILGGFFSLLTGCASQADFQKFVGQSRELWDKHGDRLTAVGESIAPTALQAATDLIAGREVDWKKTAEDAGRSAAIGLAAGEKKRLAERLGVEWRDFDVDGNGDIDSPAELGRLAGAVVAANQSLPEDQRLPWAEIIGGLVAIVAGAAAAKGHDQWKGNLAHKALRGVVAAIESHAIDLPEAERTKLKSLTGRHAAKHGGADFLQKTVEELGFSNGNS